ncbi:AAA family ATPase [Actinokineospora spheciospongiae]|uniref:AAA family ATPase n=1 Tax=Actinokineospora spheciospongiae TaxID=909613 RepID=UPI000D809F9E|nr:LuxR family transcriptional regulator [Actinokineospora spheciospongiae]PWW67121.1 transcriptional regulator [Actinokineospora spheciospongiae]
MDLVGRTAEHTAVRDAVDGAASGPRALLLLGDPGEGRTTLLAAGTERATAAGYLVLAGQGCPAESEQPFAALHQLLRPVLTAVDDLTAHLRDAVLTAFGLVPGAPDPTSLRVAVLTLLGALSARRPVLLVVDDVHLADRDSCAVLGFALRRLSTERLVVLLAARGAVRPSRVDEAVPAVVLGPLSEGDAARLLDALPGAPTGRARLDVLRQAAGSPLALVELARAVGGTAAPWVREVFADRLRDLPEDTRRLLVYAAADHDDLATTMAAAGIGDDLTRWAPAEDADLLSIADGRVRFRHPLVRAAAYHGAPAALRARAHRDLADALAATPDRRAWHLAAAAVGPDEDVAAALEGTAALARLHGGVFAAARALERAAECTPDPGERARRYAGAITAADDVGDPAWVRDLHRQVTRLTDDPDVLGVAACGAGRALSLSARQREAFTLLLTGLREHRPRAVGTALALTGALAAVSVQSGLPEHRAPLPDLLARLDRDATGPAAPQVWAVLREDLLAHADPAANAVRIVRSEHAAVHRGLTGAAEVTRLLCLGSVAWLADESDTAVTAFRQALAAPHPQRSTGAVVRCAPALASALIATGRWAEADDLLDEVSVVAAVHRLHHLAADVAALRAELVVLRGGPGARVAPGWPSIELDENRATHARLLRAAGLAALVDGDGETAYRHLRALFAADGTPLHHVLSAHSVADLAAAARLTGDAGHADDTAALVAAERARHGGQPTTRMRLLLRHAEALVGEVERADGPAPLADTERAYRLAVVDPAGEQWPLERACARLHYARWLRRRRRALEARPLLSAALDTFTRLGAVDLADRTRAELRASGAAPGPAPAADPLADLTSQQREIVRLAARGLRNREIAEQLFLSHRTVGSHLHAAYPKLGISGRHQLRDVLGDH